jgi:hypothetical protein
LGAAHITFNIPSPRNVQHMFGTWTNQAREN